MSTVCLLLTALLCFFSIEFSHTWWPLSGIFLSLGILAGATATERLQSKPPTIYVLSDPREITVSRSQLALATPARISGVILMILSFALAWPSGEYRLAGIGIIAIPILTYALLAIIRNNRETQLLITEEGLQVTTPWIDWECPWTSVLRLRGAAIGHGGIEILPTANGVTVKRRSKSPFAIAITRSTSNDVEVPVIPTGLLGINTNSALSMAGFLLQDPTRIPHLNAAEVSAMLTPPSFTIRRKLFMSRQVSSAQE